MQINFKSIFPSFWTYLQQRNEKWEWSHWPYASNKLYFIYQPLLNIACNEIDIIEKPQSVKDRADAKFRPTLHNITLRLCLNSREANFGLNLFLVLPPKSSVITVTGWSRYIPSNINSTDILTCTDPESSQNLRNVLHEQVLTIN